MKILRDKEWREVDSIIYKKERYICQRTYQHTLRSELTKDYRMLLCMIGMMEKILGLWNTNLFFLLLMWGVLDLWPSCSRMLWPFADTFTNQTSSLPWLLIPSGQKSSVISFLVRQLLIILTLYHGSLSRRRKHSSSSLIMVSLC